ncbi:MAG TPA: hypothetical protein VF581_11470 [Flavobacterium sp.]
MKTVNKLRNGGLILFLLCFSTYFSSVQAQHVREGFACSYYGEKIPAEVGMTAPGLGAEAVISRIMAVVGLKPNFEIRAANIPNAAAVILDNKRYILYNKRFINAINAASGNDWAGISIIAHEIGHHLNGHTLKKGGSRPDIELEADEFSGFVLNKLGAGIEDAQAAMSIAASQKSSHSHPARKDRLVAIARGWNNAGNADTGVASNSDEETENIRKPAPVKSQPAESNTLEEEYIAFNVHFDADKGGSYYITTDGSLVNISDNTMFVIGRLAESNRRGYKLMLSHKSYNYLYLGAKGIIYNSTGRKVGKVTARS